MPTCIVIPYYNHGQALAQTLRALQRYDLPCFIVDDGSDAASAAALADAQREWPRVRVLRHEFNQGKGAAVVTGIRAAQAAGFTHAIQIDADNQHDAATIAVMLERSRAEPRALICGFPVYDASVPRARLYGRYVTHCMVWLNTLSFAIRDSMCGLRLYPLESMLDVWEREHVGRRMDFDTEILVRMYWRGIPLVQVPTAVRYPQGGVSHFRLWRDNVNITLMHTRLFFGMLRRLPQLLGRRFGAAASHP